MDFPISGEFTDKLEGHIFVRNHCFFCTKCLLCGCLRMKNYLYKVRWKQQIDYLLKQGGGCGSSHQPANLNACLLEKLLLFNSKGPLKGPPADLLKMHNINFLILYMSQYVTVRGRDVVLTVFKSVVEAQNKQNTAQFAKNQHMSIVFVFMTPKWWKIPFALVCLHIM